MDAALAGLLTGLSLIVAIGAQNAYLLRLGLSRTHVGMAVAICAIADALLIVAGIAGVGAIVRAHEDVLRIVSVLGAAYLLWFAIRSFRSARRPDVLLPSEQPPQPRRSTARTMAALTLLNPHVYLDTVVLVGSIGSTFGDDRWRFAAGAVLASLIWFSSLGYGARLLSPLMSRPTTWRVLDAAIGVVMLAIAAGLLRTALG